MKSAIKNVGMLFAARVLAGTSRRVHDPRPSEEAALSRRQVFDAHRRGEVVYEVSHNGNRQVVNPFRRDRKAMKRSHGIESGRQWVKFRKRLQRERRAAA